jgi:hypothetical protein
VAEEGAASPSLRWQSALDVRAVEALERGGVDVVGLGGGQAAEVVNERRADGGGGPEGAIPCSPARGSPTRQGQRGEAGELLEGGGGSSRWRSRSAGIGQQQSRRHRH